MKHIVSAIGGKGMGAFFVDTLAYPVIVLE